MKFHSEGWLIGRWVSLASRLRPLRVRLASKAQLLDAATPNMCRSASVRAVTDCELIALVRWDFLAVLRSNIEVALAMLPVLSRRLRECEDLLLP